MAPMKPSTVMATASPLGTLRLAIQRTAGLRSPDRSAATRTGMMRKLTWLSIQTRPPITSRMSPARQAQAAAIRTP